MAGSLLKAVAESVGIDPKIFSDVAQTGHFLAGCLAVFMPVALTGQLRWGVVGTGVLIGWAIGKEFWWDEKYETTDVRGSSLEDFVFYCLGPPPSLLLCWLV